MTQPTLRHEALIKALEQQRSYSSTSGTSRWRCESRKNTATIQCFLIRSRVAIESAAEQNTKECLGEAWSCSWPWFFEASRFPGKNKKGFNTGVDEYYGADFGIAAPPPPENQIQKRRERASFSSDMFSSRVVRERHAIINMSTNSSRKKKLIK